MKTLLLLATLLIGFTSVSQEPDPDLYQTWYLTSYQIDLEETVYIADINPSISPTITFSESPLSFSGRGACNTFTGSVSEFPDTNGFFIEDFTPTDLLCDFGVHNDFEQDYFNYFNFNNEIFYLIESKGSDEQSLTLSFPDFSMLEFSSIPLSIFDIAKNPFKIYPNPATETLFITSENNTIQEISVFSVNGKLVLSDLPIERHGKNNTNQLNVSTLSKGLYFAEITSENGMSVQKFIKQ